MAALTQFLIDYGYGGMFVAAFLAGSFFPFSSEVVIIALQIAGLSVVPLLFWGTTGNVLGSCFNYWLGHLGKMEWIEKYAHVKHRNLIKAEVFVRRYGAWMGLLAWIPFLGSAITIALGLLRANFWWTCLAITVGKLARYAFVLFVVTEI